MKAHSVSDIITNSSTMIFVQAKNKTPIEEFFEKLGVKVTVEFGDDAGWLEERKESYEDEYYDGDQPNGMMSDAPSFERYLEDYRDDNYPSDKTIFITLESGEKVDLKDLVKKAFEINSTYN